MIKAIFKSVCVGLVLLTIAVALGPRIGLPNICPKAAALVDSVVSYATMPVTGGSERTVSSNSDAPTKTFTCKTTWYSRKECCTRKNPNALMANGEPLDDNAFTGAMWADAMPEMLSNIRLGTKLWVATLDGSKHIVITIKDRGPNRRFKHENRLLDLSKAAFAALAPLREGKIEVQIGVSACE